MRGALNPMTGALTSQPHADKEGPVTTETEAEIGITSLQVRERQGTPRATRSWKGGGKVLPRAFRERWPSQHPGFGL